MDAATSGDTRGPAEIQRWMQDNIASVLKVPAESLDPAEPIMSYGLDSIAAFTLTLDLSEWLQRDLEASLLWEYPTIAELAKVLGEAQQP